MTAGPSGRSVIQVPKKLQGKVIGRRGATIADIESDYPGVKVSVPKRDDPSLDVVITGPEDAVKHAEARIKDICGMNHEDRSLRKHAHDLFDEANKLYAQAKQIHNNQHAKDAAYAKAKAKRKEAEAAQEAAAKFIFEKKNAGYGDDQMDLHGLYVDEAVKYVSERLDKVDQDLRTKTLKDLTIITGAGHHSENHKAKIKPEIKNLLARKGYPYTEDESGGIIMVSFDREITPTTPSTAQPQSQEPTQTTPPTSGKDGEGANIQNVVKMLCALGSCVMHLLCTLNDGQNSREAQQNRSQNTSSTDKAPAAETMARS